MEAALTGRPRTRAADRPRSGVADQPKQVAAVQSEPHREVASGATEPAENQDAAVQPKPQVGQAEADGTDGLSATVPLQSAIHAGAALRSAAAESRDCKGCTASVHDDAQIRRVLAALSRHPESCVDDDVYMERLAACGSCPSLAYGTTCLHCGCFVAVRAKMRDKHCPMPGGARW